MTAAIKYFKEELRDKRHTLGKYCSLNRCPLKYVTINRLFIFKYECFVKVFLKTPTSRSFDITCLIACITRDAAPVEYM